MAAVAPLLMLAAGFLWGLDVTEDVPFFGITAAVGLIGAFLVQRFGTWSKVVGILAALALAAMLFWTAFGLATPNSFFDFVPGLLVIPGAIIAIVGCIAAIVARRRGHLTPAPVGGERRAISIVLGVVIALALASAAMTFLGASDVEGGDVTVTASDFDFEDGPLTVQGGDEVVVKNEDPFLHTFTIEELNIDVAVQPGSEELVQIPDRPGTYVVYCVPHTMDPKEPSDDDMATEITIQ